VLNKLVRFFTAIAVVGAVLLIVGVIGTNEFQQVNSAIWTGLILLGAWFLVLGVCIRWKGTRARRAAQNDASRGA